MLLFRLLFFSIFFNNIINDIPKDKSIFVPPIKIQQLLSSNFGELRINHFHSGLDIKTQGVTGIEVVAAADGYIYRISVSPTGFGNALYIRHPSGYSTVYGHLEKFSPEIDEYVKNQQYEKKSFTVMLYPKSDEFPVKQGQVIAYSGNSGGSTGPHLHFEIRKSDGEKPINPLLFDLGITDNTRPIIEKLAIYPLDRHTMIDNQNAVKKMNVSGSHGIYSIQQDNEISISGNAGFGIKAYDLLNESNNRCAVYSIELLIDSVSIYKYIMNSFSFDESRYVNSHIDYETFMKDNIYIERTYILPNDKLSVCKETVNRGIFNFNDNKTHTAEIIVTDANNNHSTLSFKIRSNKNSTESLSVPIDKNKLVMPFGRNNKFASEDISIRIPEGALYDTLYFTYKKEKGTIDMLSDMHFVHDKFTPVHIPYTISIKPTSVIAGKESKMLIIRYEDELNKIAVNSTWTGEYLTADVLYFGKYYVGIDTVPPVISPYGLAPGSDLSGAKEIKIKISDRLSGIKSYEPIIDGNWALFEYDLKNDLLIYNFDEKRIKKGIKHYLSLKVTDNKDNVSYFKSNFKW